jgi:hypothetical protein
MTECEERAIKIAESKYEGWKKKIVISDFPSDHMLPIWCKESEGGIKEYTKLELINTYSSFNGLMPIVERVNRSNDGWIFTFDEGYITIAGNNWYQLYCSYQKENETLIDALQRAILYILKIEGRK